MVSTPSTAAAFIPYSEVQAIASTKEAKVNQTACGNHGDMLVLATDFAHAAMQNKFQNLH